MTIWATYALCHDKTLMKLSNLREKISELTLKGLFWGKNGALALEKEGSKINKRFGFHFTEFLSGISSTYYAASGNAVSLADGIPFLVTVYFRIFWLWRAWRCLRKAEIFSDKFAALRRMEDMSLGELDTRACILNKRGRRNEALALISHGIMKILTGQIGTKHDLCLFLIHEAETITSMRRYDKENKTEKNYQQALKLSEDETVPALTKVRVMKSYGKFLAENKRIDEAESMLGNALDLARENDLYDQERKLKAIFKTFNLAIR